MKKVFIFFTKSTILLTSLILQFGIFIVSSVLIFIASYILGHNYLTGNSLMGNDTANFFNVVYWINKYYPSVPFWFPVQGGGVSFTGYPWFAAYLVNTISHFTSLSLVQSFRALGFLSVPLTGIGIFVFIWTRLTEVKPVWLRQMLGIIASLFFVTAPVTWVWLMQWGFYADMVSIIFVPWILLFFDLFIKNLFEKKKGWLYRFGFTGTMLFLLLGFLTHFFIGITCLTLFLFWIFVKLIFAKEKRIVLLRRLALPLIMFILVYSGLFIFRYYSYSHYVKAVAQGGFVGYSKAGDNKEASATMLLKPEHMLSLSDPVDPVKEPSITIKDMRFPFYVWLLLLPGLLFSVFKSRKIFAFSVFSILGFLVNTNIDLYVFFNDMPLIKSIPLINQLPTSFLGRPFFVVGRVVIPIVAAYGAYILWELIWTVILLPLKKRLKILYFTLLPIKAVTICLLTLLTLAFFISRYYSLPSHVPFMVNAGVTSANDQSGSSSKSKSVIMDGLSLYDIWRIKGLKSTEIYDQHIFITNNPQFAWYDDFADFDSLRKTCSFSNFYDYLPGQICYYYKNITSDMFAKDKTLLFPPKDIVISARDYCAGLSVKQQVDKDGFCKSFYTPVASQLELKNWPDFNISSDISADIVTAKKFLAPIKDENYRYDVSGYSAKSIMTTPLISTNEHIPIYMNTLSLIYNSWNYGSQVMYTKFPLNQKPGVLTELGKWYGLDYTYLLGSSSEPISYWDEDPNWTPLSKDLGEGGWRKFNQPTGQTTWDNRPKVLVISDNSKFFYDQTFRFLTKGALTYDQGIPVQGNSEVDSYSADQLKQYDAIIMRGYKYHWRWNAYRLLDQYVKNGGKLIFDTGWQYYSPDYQLENAPTFMPFDKLTWANLSPDSQFVIEDPDIAKDIDATKIGDLKFDKSSWGVSVPGALRDWAKPVLSYDGKPLIAAGDYGQGKVVWIGFNIIPHSETKDSLEEVKLFNSLISYLFNGQNHPQDYPVITNRVSPDKLEFQFNQQLDNPSSLFFRESYYPDWHAHLISQGKKQNIQVRRAGPGFMLLLMPPVQSGDQLVLQIEPSLGQIISNAISITTVIGLFLYLFFPKLFNLIGFRLIHSLKFIKLKKNPAFKTNSKIKQMIKKVNILSQDEEDY